MKQVYSATNCLLYQRSISYEKLDRLDPTTIFPPGDRCQLCIIETGKPGEDGFGVIRLPDGLKFNQETRLVEPQLNTDSSLHGCLYECRIPARVRVEAM